LLKPGMTAAVRVVTAEHRDVLRVPYQALRFTPTGSGRAKDGAPAKSSDAAPHKPRSEHAVWKLADGRPVRVPVEIGLDDDTFTEILSGGLTVDDTIIVGSGNPGATPGGVAGGAGAMPRIPRL